MFALRNRRIAIFGARTIFLRRAVDSSSALENRLCDVDSIEVVKSDRKVTRIPLCLHNELEIRFDDYALNSGNFQELHIFTIVLQILEIKKHILTIVR